MKRDTMIETTAKTRLRRFPQRGVFDRATINAILDEGVVCHLGFTGDGGQPYVIPTAYARVGDALYVHGSAASRTLRAGARDVPVCVTVSLTDGIVLARSAFNHSFNYRSVVVVGRAVPITGRDEKERALHRFTDSLVPGRWNDVRKPTPQETKATTVLAIPLDEASAKVRSGPPVDEGDDLEHPAWAGVIPLELTVGAPVPDPSLGPGVPEPQYVTG